MSLRHFAPQRELKISIEGGRQSSGFLAPSLARSARLMIGRAERGLKMAIASPGCVPEFLKADTHYGGISRRIAKYAA